MADERTRYFRRLRSAAPAPRGGGASSAGGLGGAAAVLTPYAGIGLPDAAWAGAGGRVGGAGRWRWIDLRALAALPAPPALDPAEAAARSRARLIAAVERLPGRPPACWPRCAGSAPGYALRGTAVGRAVGPAGPGRARPWPGWPAG